MHDNSEKKLYSTQQRHITEGAPDSEVDDTPRGSFNVKQIPDIVEEHQPNEIELAEMKQRTPQIDMVSIEEPLVDAYATP